MIKTRSAADLIKSAPTKAKRPKFGNVTCYDAAGNFYHSKAERAATLALFDAHKRGACSEPRRKRYRFELNGVLIGHYTSDAEIEVFVTFTLLTRGGIYNFEAGKSYTIDVKSPATKTTASNLRFRLMEAFFGIVVFEVLTRAPDPKKPEAAPESGNRKGNHDDPNF